MSVHSGCAARARAGPRSHPVEPFDARRDVLLARRALEELALERLVVRRGGPLAIAGGGEPLGHRDQQRLLVAWHDARNGREARSDLRQLDVGRPFADHHAIPETSTAFVRPPAWRCFAIVWYSGDEYQRSASSASGNLISTVRVYGHSPSTTRGLSSTASSSPRYFDEHLGKPSLIRLVSRRGP
jgi:hypothetical protein